MGGVPMGGVNMDISLSQLGIPSASAMGRADEAERTRRLHNIIETLKQKPGRISEENVLALCTRLGIPYEKEGENYILPVGESNLLEVSAQSNVNNTAEVLTCTDYIPERSGRKGTIGRRLRQSQPRHWVRRDRLENPHPELEATAGSEQDECNP